MKLAGWIVAIQTFVMWVITFEKVINKPDFAYGLYGIGGACRSCDFVWRLETGWFCLWNYIEIMDTGVL